MVTDPNTTFCSLQPAWTSKSSCDQRKGNKSAFKINCQFFFFFAVEKNVFVPKTLCKRLFEKDYFSAFFMFFEKRLLILKLDLW